MWYKDKSLNFFVCKFRMKSQANRFQQNVVKVFGFLIAGKQANFHVSASFLRGVRAGKQDTEIGLSW